MPPKKKAKAKVAPKTGPKARAKGAGPPSNVWQYREDNGVWTEFHQQDSDKIHEAFAAGTGDLVTRDLTFNRMFNSEYRFDFLAMTQTNTGTKKTRTLQRPGGPGKMHGACQGAAAGPVVAWHWKDEGKWIPYADEDCRTLTELASRCPEGPPRQGEAGAGWRHRTQDLSFNGDHGTEYELDFAAMVQVNLETKKRRPIRRGTKAVGSSGETEDGVGYASVLSQDSSSWKAAASKAAPAPAESPACPPPLPPCHPCPQVLADLLARKGTLGREDVPVKKVQLQLASPLTSSERKKQADYGAQSYRANPKATYGPKINGDKHAKSCFDAMVANEKRLSGEYAVFYHSYSLIAPVYEVQAAVASVLFGFPTDPQPPHQFMGMHWAPCHPPFEDIPDAASLMKVFPTFGTDRDHAAGYRAVGLSCTTSLVSTDKEATPTDHFLQGYSCSDMSFMDVLKKLLAACGVPAERTYWLAKRVIELSEEHGLDVSQFGGKAAKERQGHLLQIFMKREVACPCPYLRHTPTLECTPELSRRSDPTDHHPQLLDQFLYASE
eukprot:gene2719-3366_t